MQSLYELYIHQIPEKEENMKLLEKILSSCHHLRKLYRFELKDLSLRREGVKLLCEALRQLSQFNQLKSFRLFNVKVFFPKNAPWLCSV
jgi:hypothetical protein